MKFLICGNISSDNNTIIDNIVNILSGVETHWDKKYFIHSNQERVEFDLRFPSESNRDNIFDSILAIENFEVQINEYSIIQKGWCIHDNGDDLQSQTPLPLQEIEHGGNNYKVTKCKILYYKRKVNESLIETNIENSFLI